MFETSHSVADIKNCKSYITNVCTGLCRFRDIHIFYITSLCQGVMGEKWDLHHSIANVRVFIGKFVIFLAAWQQVNRQILIHIVKR